jgi:spore coat polysaccharide biosynthesis predicted glycosyltransferase SpsG/RimJ/RimL family protein N-acetyltransferase
VASERSDWVVFDGYELGADLPAAAREEGARSLIVDDLGVLSGDPVDILLTQNAHASRAAYAGRTGGMRLLLGPRYALLRRAFAAYGEWRRSTRSADLSVLVTLGGADPAGATELVLGAIGDAMSATVVLGGANPRADAIERGVRADGVTLLRDTEEMPRLMAEADLAVAAAGSTAWELAYMQLPALAIVVADNQLDVAASIAEAGVAINLGRVDSLDGGDLRRELTALAADLPRRERMAAAGRALVDGNGARRVVRAMEAAGLRLRPVTDADAGLLLDWANDPATRAASFRSTRIEREAHLDWLGRQLVDPDAALFIGEDERPVGQVRLSRESEGVAVISISVAPHARGRGYAPALIDAGVRTIFARWPIARVRAEIKADNAASLASFADAGFTVPEPLAERPGVMAMWLDRIAG